MKHTFSGMRLRLGSARHLPKAQVGKSGPALRRSAALRQIASMGRKAQVQVMPAGPAPAAPEPSALTPLPSADLSPFDVWWRLEDLWRRLAQSTPVRLEEDGDGCRLVITGCSRMTQSELGLLCAHARDTSAYEWHVADQKGSFAQQINRQGDDLVCQWVPAWRIESWPEGPEVAALVLGFLARQRFRQAQAKPWRAAA